ncbi:MAG: heme d1 biosynthesis radical SAM protein NirJ [Rhodocyclaceae bacterium]|nr:heme d1 biosynthesis radical SAM protein NirJ [Rhodocyclaceae bacterium]
MFRLSQFLQELLAPTPAGPFRAPKGPVVIWNLIRRCNLACKHCYAVSADVDFKGELAREEIFSVMEDLKRSHVPALILSGGEPLMRPDFFAIARHAKALGFYTALSTNGTLIDAPLAEEIADVGFDYVGISLDGLEETHDRFRRMPGAFRKSLSALRLCRDAGLKVGVRFTLTRENYADLSALLRLIDDEGIDRFYLSHLNYAGRGNKNRRDDAHCQMTRTAMTMLFETAWRDAEAGRKKEFTTGNNDADGVFFLHWVRQRWPEKSTHIAAKLVQWGGNASGVAVANIDNLGNVHPDTMWWHYRLGNVRERSFAEIWSATHDPLLAGLKRRPRPVEGRCAHCAYLSMCNGNTRVRAEMLTGNPWAEDPGCYLSDEEIR